MATERKRTDKTICKYEQALTGKIREEADIREDSINCLDSEALLEAKLRQQRDQVLANEVSRLREKEVQEST